METVKRYIKMAQDNKKIVMAGVVVLIVIIALINQDIYVVQCNQTSFKCWHTYI